MPRGRPKKIQDAETLDQQSSVHPEPVQTQELLDEIAELKRELSERATIEQSPVKAVKAPPADANDVMNALASLIAKGASVQPSDPTYAAFKAKLNQKFVLSDVRKEQIETLIREAGAGKLQFQWDQTGAPSITFRRNIFIRSFDADLEAYVKAEVAVTESIHASQDDRTFKLRIREMLSLKSAK